MIAEAPKKRKRLNTLPPVVWPIYTLWTFLSQVLTDKLWFANAESSHCLLARQKMLKPTADSAYCQARKRLPENCNGLVWSSSTRVRKSGNFGTYYGSGRQCQLLMEQAHHAWHCCESKKHILNEIRLKAAVFLLLKLEPCSVWLPEPV